MSVGLLLLWLPLWSTSASAQAVRHATYDFTGDGTSDLLVRSGSTIGFWDFDAGGVINRRYLGEVAVEWSIAGGGDYNGDGTSDILFRHATTGAVGYWAMANGSFSRFVPLCWDTGPGWRIVSSRKRSDFNGDGRDDILWRNDSGLLGIYQMTAAGPEPYQWVVIGAFDPAWVVIGTGDFNGDGRADILWRNWLNGDMGYFSMNGGTILGWVPLPSVAPAWQLRQIGDFNGDGYDDIYWGASYAYVQPALPFGYWDMAQGSSPTYRPQLAQFKELSDIVLNPASGDYTGDGIEDVLNAWSSLALPPQTAGWQLADFEANDTSRLQEIGTSSWRVE